MKFIFSSFPDFSDNSFVILKYIISEKIPGKIYWLVSKSGNIKLIREKMMNYFPTDYSRIKLVKKNSVLGIFLYLSANYIFETHGMFEKFPILPWQKKINLWHGMPLKKIGWLSDHPVKMKMNYSISTAPIFNEIIEQAFKISNAQVIPIGLPRNDLFFKKSNFNFSSLFGNEYPTIAWLPTYRKNNIGDINLSGEQKTQEIGGFSYNELEQLDSYLGTQQTNLVVKLHPMDILNLKTAELANFKNIIVLTATKFSNLCIEVNDFLTNTQALVTDYSSVYFDYLLSGHPIGVIKIDENEYAKQRGFVSEEVLSKFEGFKIQDVYSFQEFIRISNENPNSISPTSVDIFNSYDRKGDNSKILLEYIGIKK